MKKTQLIFTFALVVTLLAHQSTSVDTKRAQEKSKLARPVSKKPNKSKNEQVNKVYKNPNGQYKAIKWNKILVKDLSKEFRECVDHFYASLFSIEISELLKHPTKELLEIYFEQQLSQKAQICSNEEHYGEKNTVALFEYLESREDKRILKKVECWSKIPFAYKEALNHHSHHHLSMEQERVDIELLNKHLKEDCGSAYTSVNKGVKFSQTRL